MFCYFGFKSKLWKHTSSINSIGVKGHLTTEQTVLCQKWSGDADLSQGFWMCPCCHETVQCCRQSLYVVLVWRQIGNLCLKYNKGGLCVFYLFFSGGFPPPWYLFASREEVSAERKARIKDSDLISLLDLQMIKIDLRGSYWPEAGALRQSKRQQQERGRR